MSIRAQDFTDRPAGLADMNLHTVEVTRDDPATRYWDRVERDQRTLDEWQPQARTLTPQRHGELLRAAHRQMPRRWPWVLVVLGLVAAGVGLGLALVDLIATVAT